MVAARADIRARHIHQSSGHVLPAPFSTASSIRSRASRPSSTRGSTAGSRRLRLKNARASLRVASGRASPPTGMHTPGVATRSVLAWMLGTGLPVFGVVAIGLLALGGDRGATPHQLGIAMVVLGGTGIVVGLLAVTLAARATADPVDSVRRALARVQRGDLDVRVPVGAWRPNREQPG